MLLFPYNSIRHCKSSMRLWHSKQSVLLSNNLIWKATNDFRFVYPYDQVEFWIWLLLTILGYIPGIIYRRPGNHLPPSTCSSSLIDGKIQRYLVYYY
jgi:hypothetical protein